MRQAMIIEDDQGTREIYRLVLRSIGYDAVEAGDGEVALRMLRQITPDVILLDLRLPHRSGAEILGYIQSDPRLRHSRVVIVTAHSVVTEDLHLRPGDVFLLKPVRTSVLREVVVGAPAGK